MGRESLNYRRGRSGRPYRRTKAEVFANETHCRRCGRPVNMALPYKDPITGKVNRWSKSYGHKVELDRNGNPYVGGLEHLHCNTKAGAEYGNAKRTRKRSTPGGTDLSYDWS